MPQNLHPAVRASRENSCESLVVSWVRQWGSYIAPEAVPIHCTHKCVRTHTKKKANALISVNTRHVIKLRTRSKYILNRGVIEQNHSL